MSATPPGFTTADFLSLLFEIRPKRSAYQRTALVTLPARMQDVHTCTRLADPPTTARIRWMFGFQRRFVRLCEWLTLIPKDGFLPHTSQTDAILSTPRRSNGTTHPRRKPDRVSRSH
jgi:hypothetical protein